MIKEENDKNKTLLFTKVQQENQFNLNLTTSITCPVDETAAITHIYKRGFFAIRVMKKKKKSATISSTLLMCPPARHSIQPVF